MAIPTAIVPLLVWPASNLLKPDQLSKAHRWRDIEHNMFMDGTRQETHLKWGDGKLGAYQWHFKHRHSSHDTLSILIAGGVSVPYKSQDEHVLLFLACLLYSYSTAFAFRKEAKWLSSGDFGHPAGDNSRPVETAGLLYDGESVFFQVAPSDLHKAKMNPSLKPIRCQLNFGLFQVAYNTGLFSPAPLAFLNFFRMIELLSGAITSGMPEAPSNDHERATVGVPYARLGYKVRVSQPMLFDLSGWLAQEALLASFRNTVIFNIFPFGWTASSVRFSLEHNLAAYFAHHPQFGYLPGLRVPLRRMLRDQCAQSEDLRTAPSPAIAVAEWTLMKKRGLPLPKYLEEASMTHWRALQTAICKTEDWEDVNNEAAAPKPMHAHWTLHFDDSKFSCTKVNAPPQPSVIVKSGSHDLPGREENALNLLLCLFRTWPDNFAANAAARWSSIDPFGSDGNPAFNDNPFVVADLLYDGKTIYSQTWLDRRIYPVVCRWTMRWVLALIDAGLVAFPFPIKGQELNKKDESAKGSHQEVIAPFFDTIALLSRLLRDDTVPVDFRSKGILVHKNRRLLKGFPNPSLSAGLDLGFYWAWKVAEELLFAERWSWSDQYGAFSQAANEAHVVFHPRDPTSKPTEIPLEAVLRAKGRMSEYPTKDGPALKAHVPDNDQSGGANRLAKTDEQKTPVHPGS